MYVVRVQSATVSQRVVQNATVAPSRQRLSRWMPEIKGRWSTREGGRHLMTMLKVLFKTLSMRNCLRCDTRRVCSKVPIKYGLQHSAVE